MIAAALLLRMPTVVLEGSPVSPIPDRFAAIISRRKVTILKSGSTMMRMLMTSPTAPPCSKQHDLTSLRLGILCAEPVHAATHKYASVTLTSRFINCYWATEHGGMLFGAIHPDAPPRLTSAMWDLQHGAWWWQMRRQRLLPDGRTWPLPWVDAEAIVREDEHNYTREGPNSSTSTTRRALDGERGELIVSSRWPYMALTVWESDGFDTWCDQQQMERSLKEKKDGGGEVKRNHFGVPLAPVGGRNDEGLPSWMEDGSMSTASTPSSSWVGDLNRWSSYFERLCLNEVVNTDAEVEYYVQGDVAIRHRDDGRAG